MGAELLYFGEGLCGSPVLQDCTLVMQRSDGSNFAGEVAAKTPIDSLHSEQQAMFKDH